MGTPQPWAWGAAAGAILLAPGALWPPLFGAGVRAWNGAVRRIAGAVGLYALRLTYVAVIAPLHLAGTPRTPQRQSWWHVAAPDQPGPASGGGQGESPGDALRTLARLPGHRWVLALLPLVTLLNLVDHCDEDGASVPPGSTYTLY